MKMCLTAIGKTPTCHDSVIVWTKMPTFTLSFSKKKGVEQAGKFLCEP